MTIQEAGNNDMWLDEVIRICKLKTVNNEGRFSLIVSNKVHLSIRTWPDLDIELEINLYVNDRIVSISYDTYYKINNHEFAFQFDTEGILMLVDNIKKSKLRNTSDLFELVFATDHLYRDKYHGMLAGKRFGF